MDEILFHLRAPLEGTGGGMLQKYAARCLLPAILIMICIFIMIVHTRHASKTRGIFVKRTIIGALIASDPHRWDRHHEARSGSVLPWTRWRTLPLLKIIM